MVGTEETLSSASSSFCNFIKAGDFSLRGSLSSTLGRGQIAVGGGVGIPVYQPFAFWSGRLFWKTFSWLVILLVY